MRASVPKELNHLNLTLRINGLCNRQHAVIKSLFNLNRCLCQDQLISAKDKQKNGEKFNNVDHDLFTRITVGLIPIMVNLLLVEAVSSMLVKGPIRTLQTVVPSTELSLSCVCIPCMANVAF